MAVSLQISRGHLLSRHLATSSKARSMFTNNDALLAVTGKRLCSRKEAVKLVWDYINSNGIEKTVKMNGPMKKDGEPGKRTYYSTDNKLRDLFGASEFTATQVFSAVSKSSKKA